MPAEEKVTIIIVGKDQISKVLGGVTKHTKTMADGFDDADKKAKKGLFQTLDEIGKKSTQVGQKLTQSVTAPLQMYGQAAVGAAIESQRLGQTLTALAKDAGGAEAIITAIGDASLGTVGKLDAMKIANRALSFGVVKNTKEMKTLTEVAITLGRAQGLTATQAVSDFTTALSRNSPMILDNLGITLKMTEAYEIYADSIGVSVDQLDAEQKAIAFREAALTKGTEAMEKMGGLQDDMAGSQEKLNAQMENMALVVGEALIPLKQIGLDAMQPLVKAFQDADPAIQKVVVGMGFIASSAGPALTSVGKMLTGLEKLQGVTANAGGAMGLLKTAVTGTSGALLGVGVAVGVAAAAYAIYDKLSGDAEEATNRVRESVEKAIEQFETLEGRAFFAGDAMSILADTLRTEVNAELQKNGGLVEDLSAAFLRSTKASSIYKSANMKTNKAILEGSRTYKDYILRLQDYNKKQKDVKLRILSIADARKLSTKSMYQNLAALTKTSAMDAVRTKNLVASTKAQFEFIQSGVTYLDVAENLAERLGDLGTTEEERKFRLVDYTGILEEHMATLKYAGEVETEYQDIVGRGGVLWKEVLTTEERNQKHKDSAAARDIQRHEDEKARIAETIAAEDKAIQAREANTERLEALQVARQEAIAATTKAQQDLITAMQDVTLAEYKQKIFSMIDFGDDVQAYVKVGIELDLLDPADVNRALAIEPILKEISRDNIPIEKMGDAIGHVFTKIGEAGDIPIDEVEEKTRKLLETFLIGPAAIKDQATGLDLYNKQLERLSRDVAADAADGLTDIDDKAQDYSDKLPDYRDRQEEYNEKLGELPGDYIPKAISGIDNLGMEFGKLPVDMRKSEEFLGGVNKVVGDMEGTHYVDFVFRYHNWDPSVPTGGSNPPSQPGGRQMGGLVAGRIGEPVPITAHGGEYIVNPNHRGAMGGPGGPPLPGATNNQFGGDTINVSINDRLAAALFLSDLEGRRYDQLDNLM